MIDNPGRMEYNRYCNFLENKEDFVMSQIRIGIVGYGNLGKGV